MSLVATGIVAGVIGTAAMDVLNILFARAGVLSRVSVATIGRLAAGWARGRFRYPHPGAIRPVAHEMLYGYVTHYTIGVSLALLYVVGWEVLVGGPPSPTWAVPYGIATTVAAYILVLPSMGLGAFGLLSPEGIRVPLSSLANHLFYGLGLAAGIALLPLTA